MRLGFHCSVGKGLENTVKEALSLGCETIQIFSRSPRAWGKKEFNAGDVENFQRLLKKHDIYPLVVHMLYLANLASSDETLYAKSVAVLTDELKRCKILEAQYLVIHPGRYSTGTFDQGIKNIIDGINRSFAEVKNGAVLLLENLAGGKTDIGWRFEELKVIIDNVKDKDRIGVCLDTCHLYAAGYDISKSGFSKTVAEFDRIIGLKYLKMLHLNDSKEELGSKIDRHTHIGEGRIGIAGFRAVVNHPKIKNLFGILETPRSKPRSNGDYLAQDIKNITALRNLEKR